MPARSRSRSRSPRKERKRSRERKRRRKSVDRSPSPRERSPGSRHRQRSPARRRSRSPRDRHRSRSPQSWDKKDRDNDKEGDSKPDQLYSKPQIDASELEGMTEEEVALMSLMGFKGFDSSKGKKVEGNDIYVANIQRKRRYRQYMNRRGGFNRPLDFIA